MRQLFVMIVGLLAACSPPPSEEERRIEAAKAAVAAELRDPTSPIFSKIVAAPSPGQEVCGLVNGKNSFGAYAGPERFIWTPSRVQIGGGPPSGNDGVDVYVKCNLDLDWEACQSGKSVLTESINRRQANGKDLCDALSNVALQQQLSRSY